MTNALKRKLASVPKSFLANVEEHESGCLLWQGSTTGGNSGTIVYGDFRYKGKWSYVHRAVYEWCNGTIQPGNAVHHVCETPTCVNPHHLVQMPKADHHRLSRYVARNS